MHRGHRDRRSRHGDENSHGGRSRHERSSRDGGRRGEGSHRSTRGGDEDNHRSSRRDPSRHGSSRPDNSQPDNDHEDNVHHEDIPPEGNDNEEPPPSYTEAAQDMQVMRINDGPEQSESDGVTSEEHIGESLDAVRKFTSAIMAAKCHSCGTKLTTGEFSTGKWVMKWKEGAKRSRGKKWNDKPMICTTKCPSCGKVTCIACGKNPNKKPSCRKLGSCHLIWCCPKGRLFGIWLVLAYLDQIELLSQGHTPGSHRQGGPGGGSRRPGHPGDTGDARGIGYADSSGRDSMYGRFHGPGSARPGLSAPVSFKDTGSRTDAKVKMGLELVAELIPTERTAGLPIELFGMLQLSLILEKTAEFLRNDSLDDVTKRGGVYFEVFKFVHKLSRHPELVYLVKGPRYSKRRTAGLKSISLERQDGQTTSLVEWNEGQGASLADRLKNLAKQSQFMLDSAGGRDFRDEKGETMLDFCEGIVDLYGQIQTGQLRTGKKKKKTNEKRLEAFHEKYALTRDEDIIGPHASFAFMNRARGMTRSPPGRMKRLVGEVANMATSLPPGIFVKVSESRPDIMKCLIMGPPDSPYGYGLFEFDILCPERYPLVPPMVLSRLKIGEGVISPNIHPNGKVCLSLLGTWNEGDEAAQWQPGKSTILSVLISIQAMIFSEDPWRNEPGYTNKVGARAEHASQRYLERVQPLTIRYAMLDWLRKPELLEGIWIKIISGHFFLNRKKIIRNVSKWATKNESITNWRGNAGLTRVNLARELLDALRQNEKRVKGARRSRR